MYQTFIGWTGLHNRIYFVSCCTHIFNGIGIDNFWLPSNGVIANFNALHFDDCRLKETSHNVATQCLWFCLSSSSVESSLPSCHTPGIIRFFFKRNSNSNHLDKWRLCMVVLGQPFSPFTWSLTLRLKFIKMWKIIQIKFYFRWWWEEATNSLFLLKNMFLQV